MTVATDRPPGRHDEAETFSAAVAAITSAFGDSTRRGIYLFVKESEDSGVTATEVATRFALHPNVARHHLDKLAAGGYVEVQVERAGPGAGRPSKRYRALGEETAVPAPPHRDDLLVMLLTRALSLLDPAEAESMAVAVGEEYGRSLAAQMSPGDSQRSMRAAMRAVADALTAHGFAAHADASEPRDDPPTIVADHCPFGEVALRHPVLCSVDHGMVQGMLAGLCGYEVPVKMSSRARGDASCTTVAG